MYTVMYEKKKTSFFAGEAKESNFVGYEDLQSKYKSVAQRNADGENEKLRKGEMIVGRCKKCGKYFEINDSMLNWMKKKDFDGVPKRCTNCKKKKKP